jgi:hypothetical protein
MSPLGWLWLFFIFSSLQPIIQRALMTMSRRRLLALIAARRDATVITLIHRQETISLPAFRWLGTSTSTMPNACSERFARHLRE